MVSVIMGVYNAENESSLDKSINSILNQTYKNFELILCDDGSTDNTYEILNRYKQKDRRIVLIKNKKNMGLAFTLNHCITVSKGDILVRHDIDDYSDYKRIQKQVEFLELNRDYSIVGSNIALYDSKGIWGNMCYPKNPNKNDFLFCLPFMHGSLAMKKQDVLSVGGYCVSKLTRRTEDFELLSRMYIKGFKAHNLQENLYFYKEDKNAQNKRKFKYRIDECKVKFKMFYKMGLMPKGVPYAIKPVIVGLIPKKVLSNLKDKYYKRKNLS